VESFHGRLRDECLNVSWFWNLFDARRKISAWQREYNSDRPHSSLGYLTPEEFAYRWQLASPSCSTDEAEEQAGQGNPAVSLRSALTRLPLSSETIHQEGEARKEITL
jgi:putative transposase